MGGRRNSGLSDTREGTSVFCQLERIRTTRKFLGAHWKPQELQGDSRPIQHSIPQRRQNSPKTPTETEVVRGQAFFPTARVFNKRFVKAESIISLLEASERQSFDFNRV